MKRDYYEILGVDKGADEKQIKKAYRALAHRFHPDVNDHDPDTEEKFKEATEAYEILSDPEKRNIYDTYGPTAPEAVVAIGIVNVALLRITQYLVRLGGFFEV